LRSQGSGAWLQDQPCEREDQENGTTPGQATDCCADHNRRSKGRASRGDGDRRYRHRHRIRAPADADVNRAPGPFATENSLSSLEELTASTSPAVPPSWPARPALLGVPVGPAVRLADRARAWAACLPW